MHAAHRLQKTGAYTTTSTEQKFLTESLFPWDKFVFRDIKNVSRSQINGGRSTAECEVKWSACLFQPKQGSCTKNSRLICRKCSVRLHKTNKSLLGFSPQHGSTAMINWNCLFTQFRVICSWQHQCMNSTQWAQWSTQWAQQNHSTSMRKKNTKSSHSGEFETTFLKSFAFPVATATTRQRLHDTGRRSPDAPNKNYIKNTAVTKHRKLKGHSFMRQAYLQTIGWQGEFRHDLERFFNEFPFLTQAIPSGVNQRKVALSPKSNEIFEPTTMSLELGLPNKYNINIESFCTLQKQYRKKGWSIKSRVWYSTSRSRWPDNAIHIDPFRADFGSTYKTFYNIQSKDFFFRGMHLLCSPRRLLWVNWCWFSFS